MRKKIFLVLAFILCSTNIIQANDGNTKINDSTTTKEKEDKIVITEDNQHALGAFVPKPKARTEIEKITEKSEGKPRKDFIDVSSHNGEITVSEYKTMKKYGVKGVVVKLTEYTTYKNPYAKSQINNAKSAGLKVSAYHFSHFTDKSTAETEAKYFVNYAKELGLNSDTVMVNDFECNCSGEYNANASKNSVYFANYIKNHGYKTVLHYSYANNIGESQYLKPSIIGENNLWIAGYPYTPSENDLWYTYAEAWQWTSNLHFTGVDGTFDGNIDYTGKFIGLTREANGGLKYNKLTNTTYATVVEKKLLYKTLNPCTKGSTSENENVFHKTYKAKGYYVYNGKKYYTLYDHNDKWVGYVPENALNFSSSEMGRAYHYSTTQYATISEKDWRIWNTIAPFDTVTYKTEQLYGKTFRVSDVHYHYNGNTYVLLNTASGKKVGYLNIDAVRLTTNSYGKKTSSSNYACIENKNAPIYDNLGTLNKIGTTAKLYLDTVKNSGYYITYNGKRYYSLYDNNDEWIGYVEDKYLTITNDSCGINRKYSTTQYATIKKNDWRIWESISPFKTVKYKTEDLKNNTYRIANVYYHFNGNTYYSLRDSDNNWIGYLNKDATIRTENKKGKAYTFDKKMVICKEDYTVWENIDDFSDERYNSTDLMNKTFNVKYAYNHYNGRTYYSLYDSKDNWIGYINANAMKSR